MDAGALCVISDIENCESHHATNGMCVKCDDGFRPNAAVCEVCLTVGCKICQDVAGSCTECKEGYEST